MRQWVQRLAWWRQPAAQPPDREPHQDYVPLHAARRLGVPAPERPDWAGRTYLLLPAYPATRPAAVRLPLTPGQEWRAGGWRR